MLTMVFGCPHNGSMKRGQALLVVLLILGVVMTVGLAVVSRSVTEVSISTTAEESTRALEAAEAGVEKALAGVGNFASGTQSSPATAPFSESNATVSVANTDLGGGSFYKLPYELESGDVATIDLGGTNPNLIHFCWGTDPATPIAEVMIYSGSGGTVNMRRWILGPGFTAPDNMNVSCQGDPDTAEPQIFKYRYTLNTSAIPEPLLMMRTRMIGSGTSEPLAVHSAPANLPIQGKDTVSTGTSGNATKKVRVIRVNPDLPFMFDSALFSGSSLIK